MKRPDIDAINRDNYWRKVDIRGPDDCWIWTGARVKRGYGTFTVSNRTFIATHVALTLDGRERPKAPDHVALHGDCSDPSCVNPRHLRWGTQEENIADKFRLGRNDFRQGESGPRAKLSAQDVLAIRASKEPGRVVAPQFGICESMVSAIRRRVTWKHI